LEEIAYLYTDARCDRVKNRFLGVSVSLSEHESHWKCFPKGLKERGKNPFNSVIGDELNFP
jgi:transposase-like protein